MSWRYEATSLLPAPGGPVMTTANIEATIAGPGARGGAGRGSGLSELAPAEIHALRAAAVREAEPLVEPMRVGVALVGAEEDVVAAAVAAELERSGHQLRSEPPAAPLTDDVELGDVGLLALRPDRRLEPEHDDPV